MREGGAPTAASQAQPGQADEFTWQLQQHDVKPLHFHHQKDYTSIAAKQIIIILHITGL